MNSLLEITVTFYFEIKDAKIYGGDGSIGYSSLATNIHGRDFDVNKFGEESVENVIKAVANTFVTSAENIRLISKEEYDYHTDRHTLTII